MKYETPNTHHSIVMSKVYRIRTADRQDEDNMTPTLVAGQQNDNEKRPWIQNLEMFALWCGLVWSSCYSFRTTKENIYDRGERISGKSHIVKSTFGLGGAGGCFWWVFIFVYMFEFFYFTIWTRKLLICDSEIDLQSWPKQSFPHFSTGFGLNFGCKVLQDRHEIMICW